MSEEVNFPLISDELSTHFGSACSGIYLAAQNGDLEVVIQHVTNDPILLFWADEDGQTPLFISCRSGNLDIAKYLKDSGSDLTRARDDGFTPIHIASYHGHIHIVRYLHVSGVNVDTFEFNKGLTPLSIACATGNLEVVEYLVQNGADVETTERSGCTPLIIASGCGQFKIVQYLIHAGANLSASSTDGYTALFSASGAGHLDVVKLLQSHGASLEARSAKGSTAFYVSCANGHFEVLSFLKEAGANIESADNNNLTPLHAAVGSPKSSLRVFRYLIYHGCDITRRDRRNKVALDYARRDPVEVLQGIISSIWYESRIHKIVYENDIDGLQDLLDDDNYARELSAVGRDAWTPLHYAAMFNRSEIAALLLETGADCGYCSFRSQHTPVQIASSRNNLAVLKVLLRLGNSPTKSRRISHRHVFSG